MRFPWSPHLITGILTLARGRFPPSLMKAECAGESVHGGRNIFLSSTESLPLWSEPRSCGNLPRHYPHYLGCSLSSNYLGGFDPMTSEQYRRVGEIYHGAMELAPEDRPDFLAGACGDDIELRCEVESLLQAHERADGYFGAPALEVAAEFLANQNTPSVTGRRLSHYQVLSLIGAGGMGQVFLAEDTRLGRKVALKVLPPAFTMDPDRVRRFEQEAKAASALNQPNILTIHEINELLLVPALSGAERKLTETTNADNTRRQLPALAWSPDRRWLAVSHHEAGDAAEGLYLVSAQTGAMRRLTRPPTGYNRDYAPAFAPDGRALLFTRASGTGVTPGIYILSLSENFEPVGEAQRLKADERFVNSPVWTLDGRHVLYLAAPSAGYREQTDMRNI